MLSWLLILHILVALFSAAPVLSQGTEAGRVNPSRIFTVDQKTCNMKNWSKAQRVPGGLSKIFTQAADMWSQASSAYKNIKNDDGERNRLDYRRHDLKAIGDAFLAFPDRRTEEQ